ncbi:MAG: GNAT family N-acetyltransferase [Chitinophagales bacterium]|nr:GNAT family N-acetyltransferase [Chitinophagales bacterium]
MLDHLFSIAKIFFFISIYFLTPGPALPHPPSAPSPKGEGNLQKHYFKERGGWRMTCLFLLKIILRRSKKIFFSLFAPMDTGYFILRADVTDAPLLSKLATETFHEAYREMTDVAEMEIFLQTKYNIENCTAELQNPDMEFYIVYDLEKDAGYFMLDKSRKPEQLQNLNCIELSRIYARKEYWGKKCGKLMIEQAINFARRKNYEAIWLQVWEENKRAIEFYKHFGFTETEFKLPFQMVNRVDMDTVMVKKLTVPQLSL